MAILAALQSASIRLLGQKPATFFGADNGLAMELTDLANEVAGDVAKYQDWQALQRVGSVAANGSATEFDLPADYDRMMINSDVQGRTSWAWGYFAYSDINQFLYDEGRGWQSSPGGWIISGNKIRFSPAPSSEAIFPYITKNWARPSSGPDQPAFSNDADSFLLPERLLTLGLVWRWRENKKLDASGDQEAFIKALEEYASSDRGSRIVRKGYSRRLNNTSLPYPGIMGL